MLVGCGVTHNIQLDRIPVACGVGHNSHLERVNSGLRVSTNVFYFIGDRYFFNLHNYPDKLIYIMFTRSFGVISATQASSSTLLVWTSHGLLALWMAPWSHSKTIEDGRRKLHTLGLPLTRPTREYL